MDPVTIYDAPGLILEQIMDGEFTPSTARRALFSPNRLGPDERDVIGQRLRDAVGDSSLGRAVANVVTNPWVWLFFLTTPAAMRGGSMALFAVAKEFAPTVRKYGGFLANRGFLTNAMVTRGSDAQAAAFRADHLIREAMEKPGIQRLQMRLAQVAEDAGLDPQRGFAWREYSPGDPRREIAFRLSSALHGTIEKWHTRAPGRVRPVFKEVKAGTRTRLSLELAEEENIFRVARDPREVLREFKGGEELVDDIKAAFRERVGLLYGGGPAAVARMVSGLGAVGGSSHQTEGGRIAKYLQRLLKRVDEAPTPEKRAKAIERFEREARTAMIDPVMKNADSYFPRNIADTYVADQRLARPVAYESNPVATLSKRNVARSKVSGVPYDPEELRMIERIYGSTPELQEAIKFAEKYQAKHAKRGYPYRMWTIDPFRSIQRYFDTTARDYAMFVGDIGDEVRLANRQTRHAGIAPQPGSLKAYRGGGSFSAAIEDLERSNKAPYGGFSLADVFNGAWATSPDRHFRATVRDSIVPHIMGRIHPQFAMTVDTVNFGKKMTEAFTHTAAARAIEESGPVGRKFIQQMRDYAGTETSVGQAGSVVRGISRVLYAGHLGLNAASALVNMTQPFLFAGSWIGYKNVLKGYRDAFREMGAYLEDRARMGFRPLSAAERRVVQQKHFSFVTPDEDFLGIADTAEELLEGFTLQAKTHEARLASRSRLAFDYLMKGFEKAEHMNRLVTAHAIKHARLEELGRAGRFMGTEALLRDAGFRSTLRQFVQETQYGSHWMNTPQIFMPNVKGSELPGGGWLANPLVRQFLSFPLRSFVAAVHTSPRLAGRRFGREAVFGAMNDAVRGMAASAVLYEASKGLLNADVSRAGYAAAVTDIIPGFSHGRFTGQEGPIPIPPVVDVPYNIIKGVLGDDMELVRRNISRAIPGGIGLSRAMGVLPELPAGVGLLQGTYADWTSRTPEGMIPVFRKSDNSLVDFQEPISLLMKGIGVDFSSTSDSRVVQAILGNREEANRIKREAIAGLMTNDTARVARAEAEYFRRFKVPLRVSKDQLRSAWRQRSVTRSERVLDSLPSEIRGRFTEIVASSQGLRTGLHPENFEKFSTTRQRDADRPSTGFDAFSGF